MSFRPCLHVSISKLRTAFTLMGMRRFSMHPCAVPLLSSGTQWLHCLVCLWPCMDIRLGEAAVSILVQVNTALRAIRFCIPRVNLAFIFSTPVISDTWQA